MCKDAMAFARGDWFEGNTRTAMSNMISVLNTKKLETLKEICEIYMEKVFPLEPDEVVNWMDNNVQVFFAGFQTNTLDVDFAKKLQQHLSEKAPYIEKCGSFETLFGFLMRQKLSTLRLFLRKHKECFHDRNQSACDYTVARKAPQRGGSSVYSVMEDFLKIKPGNAQAVKRYFRTFMDKESSHVYHLCKAVCDEHHVDGSAFRYSDRVNVPDVWKIAMFLLQR
jgi:hypothetical protein